MLLEFEFSNFRSFKDKATLSLTPSAVRELPYSVLKGGADKKHDALCSSVIYGANASGKSNVILAMEFLRSLILGGNVCKNLCFPWQVVPCFYDNEKNPIEFGIKFIHQKHIFEYEIKIGNVWFLKQNVNENFVEYERLVVDNKLQFERTQDGISFPDESESESLSLQMRRSQSESSLLRDELFLTNGYKTLWNTEMYSVISDWFRSNLVVIQNISAVTSGPVDEYEKMRNATDGAVYLNDDIVGMIAKESGVYASKIKFMTDKEKNIREYASFIGDRGGVSSVAIESEGTMKLINFMPVVISVFLTGGTLVIDELDSSLHPSAVFSIVNAFHNDELNINKAQLIFTSHNPIYQKAKIFRRDEIKFIEREGESSRLYNLSDFGTSGDGGVKKSTDIMKNYLTGKYGAINYIDYSGVIREALQLNTEEE